MSEKKIQIHGKLTGKSAYEYAKEGGFSGTEEDFAKKLTEEAAPAPSTATVGQMLAVKAVDENGKVTATEAVTIYPTIPITKAKYDALVAAGTLDDNVIYVVTEGGEG